MRRYGKTYSQSIPKCLLKFNDKSLLTWTIDGLEAGCDDIWIITGYKSQEIEKLDIKQLKIKTMKIIIYFNHFLWLKI